ncbi:hypothetical protein DY037_05560 [Apilactobacillus micheneri]|uniref:hypothetical protein n=1 Tax=Apilactobacillus micheneri TaxID=1899430 RepID=UPI0011295C4F|nr:hypothetical protein [Apilactobacillus micheneri]TPR49248.1 hypothetical protein DY037_05560 [Apilactobacillus micheneri]
MSTNSMIIAKDEDGIYRGIYSHWDGYIEGNGAILNKYYTNLSKINKLINLGSVSSLTPEVPDTKDFLNNENGASCISLFSSVKSIINEYKDDIFIEYIYIFEDNTWSVMVNNGETLGDIVPLDLALSLLHSGNMDKLISLTGSNIVS